MLFQVNGILRRRTLFNQIFRFAHNDKSTAKSLHPLQSRKLIKIIGEDVSVFLQGLITNDMGHFEEGAKSMYAMFLNTKGRVLYDTLVHQWEDSFMIECDVKNLALLQKHLNFFKLKRNIKMQDMSKDFKVWALISPDIATADLEIDPRREINLYKDPRLADLGFRIIASNSLTGNSIATALGKDLSIQDNEDQYKYLRYRLGISEGAEDLPPGTSFPLEANCDYLHGVSFHKGCYIGQEVTARVHHTGVVRKRIMPLKFTETIKANLEIDSVISASSNPKSNVGKLKGVACDYGLGLMRIKEALDAKALTVGNHSLEAFKPSWWPIEAPKEKINIAKLESAPQ